ncbi:uncharacterized protein LOC141628899 [Silene latifolia]|uniref:uncharacterized protein LOC141628899 n=1 Tax=Silene latifolia TaxID=37657 RepID=UPI003D773AD0
MFPRDLYTLNFDGSHNNQKQRAGAGCIIRDDNGELVVAAAYNLVGPDLSRCNVAIAEAVGLRNGLRLARERNLNLSVIKGDSQEVIELVRGAQGRTQPPPLTSIIQEIKGNLGHASLLQINRASNRVADKLASMGSSLVTTESKVFTRHDEVPTQILDLINQEKAGNEGEDNRSTNGLRNVTILEAGNGEEDSHQDNDIRNVRNVAARNGGEDNRLANGIRTVGLVAAGAAALWGAFTQAPNIMRLLNNINAHYTLQYFGSDRNQVQKARAGCIIRNEGQFVVAAAYNLDNRYPGCNVALAEAIALKNGLKLARDNSVQLDVIDGRNREVRDLVLGLERMPPRFPQLSVVIQEIKSVLRNQGIQPEDLNINHVDEETIRVARELATVGGLLRQEAKVYNKLEDLPLRVASLFSANFA